MRRNPTVSKFFILSLLSLNAFAIPNKKVIHLSYPTIVDGFPVKAGDIEVFVPNGELATGVLAQEHSVQNLPLPADSELRMEQPHKLSSVTLPQAKVNWLLDVPFRDKAILTFKSDSMWNRFFGLVAKSPTQFPNFPAQINPKILENDVMAECDQYAGPTSSLKWNCDYSVMLAEALNQSFGTQTVQLPEQSTLRFSKWGMDTLHLHQDSTLLGLPVSYLKPIRINRWVVNGPSVIVGMTLSQDAEYDGLPLSKTGEVEFFEPDASGFSRISNFTPRTEVTLRAVNQTVTIKALVRAHLNRDKSLSYGSLASEQVIQEILFPKDTAIFLGSSESSPISSAGLSKNSKVTIDGVTYHNDIGGGTLFLDFNASGKVYRVRKVNHP